jgi:hypothetical protein
VDVSRLRQSESWKRTWWLGAIAALAIIARFVGWGTEPGTGMVTFTLGCLGIAGGWQGLKRATHWSPTEQAKAEQIKNGNMRD